MKQTPHKKEHRGNVPQIVGATQDGAGVRGLSGQSDAISKLALSKLSGVLISGLRDINAIAMDLRRRAKSRGESSANPD